MKSPVPRKQHNGGLPRITVQGRDRMDLIKLIQHCLGQRSDFPSDDRLEEILAKLRDKNR
jgi:hypothetical protein